MPEKVPDAIRSPVSRAGSGGSLARLARIQHEFAATLHVPKVFVRHQGAEHFISGSAVDTLHFPSLHPNSGQPRYRWEAQGDGVFHGFLESDEKP